MRLFIILLLIIDVVVNFLVLTFADDETLEETRNATARRIEFVSSAIFSITILLYLWGVI